MERDWLEAQLEAGRSIESIAHELGKHPSTVAYHVKKHGLRSPHAAKHAARGGVARDVLEPLVTEGRSVRAIARHLGVSYATVQHWIGRYGLTTRRAARLKESAAAREAGLKAVDLTCDRHGPTSFVCKSDGGFRCLQCRSEDVVKRRRRVKELLVEEAGGCCVLCGYSRSVAALQFHHVDPAGKAFAIARRGATRSLEAARLEAAKCVLLCGNCHAEVEAGIATLGHDPALEERASRASPG
jgi:transposase-like protein